MSKNTKSKKTVSVREIGRLTGFSRTTVAYALNGEARKHNIPEETAAKIRVVAEQLGWQPNYMLSALSTGKTRLLGMWQGGFGEPYQAWVLQTMERVARENGYALMVSPAYTTPPLEEHDLNVFARWSVDGLIAVSGAPIVQQFLDDNPNWHIPIISMGSFALTDDPRVDSVYVDVLKPAREGLQRLVRTGRRRIAMLSAHDMRGKIKHPREQLYHRFIKEWQLQEEMIPFTKGESQRRSAAKALHEHIQNYGCPEAVFCRSDETLMGAYKALRELGKNIPEDVELLGIDGIQDTEYLDNPVSTVVQPVEEMCRTAWHLLKHRLENPEAPVQHEVLQAQLAWREVD